MKNIKAIISFILAAMMIFQLVPAFAVTEASEIMNHTFNNLPTNTVTIDGMNVLGGKVKVVDMSSSNKALNMRNSSMQTTANFAGISASAFNTVFSVDVMADNMPVNLSIAAVGDANKIPVANQIFIKIVNNAVYTFDGKRIGSVGTSKFTTISVVARKSKLMDVYIDNGLVLKDWSSPNGNVASTFSLFQEAGNSCYIDNVRMYYGKKPNSKLPEAAFSESFVDIIGQEDYAGDMTFFDNRYCYTSGNPRYTTANLYPKTNKIVATRLIDYQSPTRTDYMYFERTDVSEDCFIDININNFGGDPRKFKYFKMEGDFKIDKFGGPVQFPMLRKTNGGTVSKYPATIQGDGSITFTGGQKAPGVFKKGQWVHVLGFFDLEKSIADYYVNGKQVAKNVPLGNDLTELNLVRVCLAHGDLNDFYLDNFDFTGLVNPIVNGVEVPTTVLPETTQVEEFLEDKIAMHAYGNILSKNGVKSEFKEKGIYDKYAEQFYVTADTLNSAFDLNLAENGDEIGGDIKISKDGTVTKADGSTVKLDPAPKVENGKMYVPVKQFAKDVVGKHVWWFKTGILIFADREINLDTTGWDYQTMRSVSIRYTKWNDIDHLNAYLQYVRPDIDRLKADYVATTGDTTYTQHPRLLMNDADFAKHRQHWEAQDDETFNAMVKTTLNQANGYCKSEPVPYAWDDAMRTLSKVSNNLMNRLIRLSYAYQLTGEQKYVDAVYKQFEMCHTYPDYNTSHIIDTGDDCFALAIGFDWCYDGFTEEQREFCKQVIYDEALGCLGSGLYGRITSSSNGSGQWGDFKGMSNYNAIIVGGVASAAIATLEYESDRTFTYIKDSIRSIEYSLQMLTPDGGWNEAPGYWNYAMRYIMTVGAALEKIFGTSYNLMDGQGMDNTLNYAISTLGVAGSNNYGDGSRSTGYSYNNFFYLGQRYDNKVARYMRRSDLDKAPGSEYYDLIFFDFEAKDFGPEVMNTVPKMLRTSGTEVISFRDSYDRKVAQTYFSTHFGTSSGYHQHYDEGTFVLDLLGETWIYDLGSENYNLQNELGYKDYEMYRKRAEGHNMMVINPQKYGSTYEYKLNQFAPIIDAQSNEYGGFVYADMSDIYNESQDMTIGYYLDDNMQSVTYRNEFRLNEASDIYWSINTKADVLVDGDVVYLMSNGKMVKLEYITNGTGAAWADTGNPKPLPTSPQVPEQNTNADFNKVALTYKAPKGENKLIIKISACGKPIKPIEDKPIAEWKLPEKSNLASVAGDTSFTVTYMGTSVLGSLPVYDGVMPEIEIKTNDPEAILEVTYATNENEETIIKVWDKTRSIFNMGKVKYFKASGADMQQFKTIPIMSVNVSSQPEPENHKDNMLDDDLTTRWTGMAIGEYAIFDLGTVQDVDGVGAAFWKGAERQYFFDIYVSEDGQNWTEAYMDGTSSGETEQIAAYGFDSTMKARFIKMVGRGNTVDSASKVNINCLEFRALKNKF